MNHRTHAATLDVALTLIHDYATRELKDHLLPSAQQTRLGE
ncbi:hypothetical protein [Actinomadura sp. KC06]|nr:hypothetical protein [Actinomadura sp. KC06]